MSMIQAEFNESIRCFFVFFENSLYLTEGRLPDCQSVRDLIKNSTVTDSFTDSDYKFTALELESEATQEGSKWTALPIRQFFSENSKSELCFLCARAKGLLNFRRDKVYCAKCGGLLQDDRDFTARSCTKCRKQYFPQLEPAVIVLVNKGPKILLARHQNRSDGMYSCLAGFIEAGETAEHAVRREIKEETNLSVKNIRYAGTQAWPFPDQLMLAFTAEYESGDLKIQEEEIAHADWFDRDALPKVPGPGSVAHNLIFGEL